MPIYEYTCKKCNSCFSVIQKMGSSAEDTTCPQCGSQDVKKNISSFCCSAGVASASSSHGTPHFSGGG